MTLNFGDRRDDDTNFAAECLLAMSNPVVHGMTTEDTSSEASRDSYHPVLDDNNSGNHLYMIARILTDLNKVRQAPVDCYMDDESINRMDISQSYTKFSGSEENAGKRRSKKSKQQGATPTFDSFKPRKNERELALSGKKLHRCHYEACDKVYGKSSHLKAHIRTHTGE